MNSLDPRVNRLPETDSADVVDKPAMDQLGTFEVFVQPKEGKPFQHEGAVHAPDREMAFILAKENFTRRFTCVSLSVVETRNVFVSATTEGDQNIYNLLETEGGITGEVTNFEIFHLPKRGKQHIHFRTVEATGPLDAMRCAAKLIEPSLIFYNVWAIRKEEIRTTSQEEHDLWTTLPDKKFRDAAAYKGGDKLKEYIEKNQNTDG